MNLYSANPLVTMGVSCVILGIMTSLIELQLGRGKILGWRVGGLGEGLAGLVSSGTVRGGSRFCAEDFSFFIDFVVQGGARGVARGGERGDIFGVGGGKGSL